ncbi:MAG: phosphoglycerate mutase, partial [Candidatus Margulisbacteria bacterium]|nr:phosphoglycerate mutase [Candidatus Margulisiibacteriota bacterium]
NLKLDIRILVLPDHPTPIKLMTHTANEVPFVIYQNGEPGVGGRVQGYNEKEIRKSKIRIKDGYKLLNLLLANN